MKKSGKAGLLVLLVAVVAKFVLGKLFVYSWLSHFVTLEQIKTHSITFKYFVDQHYLPAVLVYMGAYALTVAFGVPSVAPFSLLGGFLFGVFWGTAYGACAATAGSLLAFFVIRYVLRSWVQRRYRIQLERFNEHMRSYGANYLLIVHYASIIPFFFINSLAAVADVDWWTFTWTTVAGFIPLASVYAFAGRELATIKSMSDIMSPPIIAILVILVCLALLPVIIKYYRDHEGKLL